eukprot:479271_1
MIYFHQYKVKTLNDIEMNWNIVDVVFQLLCIIFMIFSCILHFYNHYRLRNCCCNNEATMSNKWLNNNNQKHVNRHIKNKSSVMIYNNMDSNNCCCCHIDIKYDRILSKIACIAPKNTELQCYPMLFLFYLIFCVFIAILICILSQIETNANYYQDCIIYLIVMSIVWEFVFNYYRYYTTIHCVQTLSKTDSTLYSKILFHFFAYSFIFLILFSFLFVINYSTYIFIWWLLFIIIICIHCLSNCYFILKFGYTLIKQYESIAELEENILQIINDSMIKPVQSMQKCSACITSLSTIYLIILLVINEFYNLQLVNILKCYSLFWCISSFIFCLIFAKNREFIKEKYFIFKQHFMKMKTVNTQHNLSIQNITNVSEPSIGNNIKAEINIQIQINLLENINQHATNVSTTTDEKEEEHEVTRANSNKLRHASPMLLKLSDLNVNYSAPNTPVTSTMQLPKKPATLTASQSDFTKLIPKRNDIPVPRNLSIRIKHINDMEEKETLLNNKAINNKNSPTLSPSTQSFTKIAAKLFNNSNSSRSVTSVIDIDKNNKIKSNKLYKSMSLTDRDNNNINKRNVYYTPSTESNDTNHSIDNMNIKKIPNIRHMKRAKTDIDKYKGLDLTINQITDMINDDKFDENNYELNELKKLFKRGENGSDMLYGVQSADAIYIKSKANINTYFSTKRSNTKAMEILGINTNWSTRSDSLRTETTDISPIFDSDDELNNIGLDFENENEIYLTDEDELNDEMNVNKYLQNNINDINNISILIEDENINIINEEKKK